jgi:hypothetical protein
MARNSRVAVLCFIKLLTRHRVRNRKCKNIVERYDVEVCRGGCVLYKGRHKQYLQSGNRYLGALIDLVGVAFQSLRHDMSH